MGVTLLYLHTVLCEISARKCLKVQECRVVYQQGVKAELGVVDRAIASLPAQHATPPTTQAHTHKVTTSEALYHVAELGRKFPVALRWTKQFFVS